MEVAAQAFRSPRPELCLGRVEATGELQRFHRILTDAEIRLSMAGHGVALNPPLIMLAYHLQYSFPDQRIL